MRNYDLLRTGCINLWRRKTRTILTALSMTIGVMCIVVLISIGIGYGESYAETVASMGSLTKIDVTPQEKMNDQQKTALLNDKAVESFKGIAGVEAVTPVEQGTGYLKSGSYISMVKLYGMDLSTAESFQLTPLQGEAPGEGMRLHPELMVTDDVAASFADPNRDWADAADADGNPLVDALASPIKLTFDYNTLNGAQSADREGRASRSGTFYLLDITGVCSSLNYTYSASAFLDLARLREWKEAAEKQAAQQKETGGTTGGSTGGTTGSSTDGTAEGSAGNGTGTGNQGTAGNEGASGDSAGSGTGSSGSGSGGSQSGSGDSQSGSGGSQSSSRSAASRDTERAPAGGSGGSGSASRGGSRNPEAADTYSLVWIKAEDVSDVQRISSLIQEAGFTTYSLNDMLETVKKQSRQIQGMLGAIGMVAMLVSGIWLASTMMMSINERTREVGILKVLGMEFSDIAKMFLTEAFLVGVAGGIAGIALSFGMGRMIPKLFADMELRCVIPWWLALSGILFAGAAALLAAWLPARNAMKISPNEAIRAE